MNIINDEDLNLIIDKRGDKRSLKDEDKDEWQKRLSPVELKENKQYDEKFFNDNEKIIKEIGANESMLRRNPEKFLNDPSLFLYRLAVSDELRKKIYEDLIKENISNK